MTDTIYPGKIEEQEAVVIYIRMLGGSRLYGTHSVTSDWDYFVVSSDIRGKVRHTVKDEMDVTEFPTTAFIEQAIAGSHQALDIMFAPNRFFFVDELRDLRERWRCGTTGMLKLRDVARSHLVGVNLSPKRLRHATRMAMMVEQVRVTGRYNPALSRKQLSIVKKTPIDLELARKYAQRQTLVDLEVL